MSPTPDHRENAGSEGFTLVELAMSASLAIVLMLVIGRVVITGNELSRGTTTTIDLEEQLWEVLTRISEELRSAGRAGEDTNGNDIEDTGEDKNGNGRFEDDWVASGGELTFNRFLRSKGFSLPITYRLVGSTIERVEVVDAAGTERKKVVAKNVTAFSVTDGTEVSVTLGLTVQTSDGTTRNGTQTIRIRPRN